MATTAASSQPGATATQILFFLRFIQQGSIVLTGFVACYFAYWHTILRDDIPLPLIVLIAACSLAYIESYLFSTLSLYQRGAPPNYDALLKTSAPCSLALAVAYFALRQVPFVTKWCEGDNWFIPIRETHGWKLSPAGVEEHHCALTCVIIAAGAVALSFTLFISAFAVIGVVKERKANGPRGYAIVGDETMDDYGDNTLFDEEDVESKI